MKTSAAVCCGSVSDLQGGASFKDTVVKLDLSTTKQLLMNLTQKKEEKRFRVAPGTTTEAVRLRTPFRHKSRIRRRAGPIQDCSCA